MPSDRPSPVVPPPDPVPAGTGSGDVAGGPTARRLHPVSPIFDLLRHITQLIPLVAVVAISGARVVVVAVAVAVVGLRFLAWSRRTWSFDGRILRIDSGVIGRSEQRVPAARIQQVELVRKLRHQILGVATLQVQTAGGGDAAEVELEVLDLACAEQLRAQLLLARDRARVPPELEGAVGAGGPVPHEGSDRDDESEEIVRLGVGRLALSGVTGAGFSGSGGRA